MSILCIISFLEYVDLIHQGKNNKGKFGGYTLREKFRRRLYESLEYIQKFKLSGISLKVAFILLQIIRPENCCFHFN